MNRRRYLNLTLLAVLAIALPLCAEDAAEFQQRGIAALKESQSNPKLIVDAARNFAKAAELFERSGDTDHAVEMNSYLYWCKKKMTLADNEAFVKGGETTVVASLKAVEEKKVEVSEAQKWFDRADDFARANSAENLLIAIRFFEVADRFKEIDLKISTAATDRSLKEMQKIVAGSAKPLPPVVLNSKVVGTAGKLAVPDAARQSAAEKQIREIFKSEYASMKRDERLALAKKLLQSGISSNDDPATRYVLLREARDVAVQAGAAELAINAADSIAQTFATDTVTERITALQKLSDAAKTSEYAETCAAAALRTVDDAIAADSYEKLKTLASISEQLAARAGRPDLITRAKDKVGRAGEFDSAWPRTRDALDKLKSMPDHAPSNLAVGTFFCFLKNDWNRGLPALARGSDERLKAAALKDLANPADAGEQAVVGSMWFELAEKSSGTFKFAQQIRAREWYSRALPHLTGLEKVKVEKRQKVLESIRTGAVRDLMKLVDLRRDTLAGNWTLQNNQLEVNGANSVTLQFPYMPPAEYDFKIIFTRTEGTDAVGQTGIFAGKPFLWAIGGQNNSLCYFHGGKIVKRSPAIVNGVRTKSLIQVRWNEIRCYLNDELILRCENSDQFLMPDDRKFKEGYGLGIGTYNSPAIFHEVEVVEISDPGKLLRTERK